LRVEASQCYNFLGQDLQGALASTVESAGAGSTIGLRRAVTQQREALRHDVITMALSQHPDREARPVFVFQNFDKMSGAWLLGSPGARNGLSSPVFAEALASHLCLPSPAVMAGNWVGKPVGSKGWVMDVFGDRLMCCNEIPGDSWRIRHDSVKQTISTLCSESGLQHDCEVYGLFADLIPEEAQVQGRELQWGRARQGLCPDWRLRLPTPQGFMDVLAELKVPSAGPTFYPRGEEGRGTDRRASRIPAYYRRQLADLDSKYHGTARGQTGPLVQRLASYGKIESLAAGPWADVSKDLAQLILTMGELRVSTRARARGRERADWELGTVVAEMRRFLSCSIVRAQGLCLLSRLCYLGDGSKSAAQRRAQSKRGEEGRRQEARAFFHSHVRGRGMSHVGQIFTR
jgi:hypothetical protein